MNTAASTAAASKRPWLEHAVRAALLVVGLSPFLPLLFGTTPLVGAVADLFDRWFAFQCHREAGRSLSVLGGVLPVCSRCAGIYFGLGLGALIARPRLGAWPLRIWVAAAAVVMLLDITTELTGLRPAWTPLRLMTGIALSYPVAVALVLAARGARR
jgi:uncharacterized membrane protein